ncbi:MAG: hypothetical protein WBP09_00385, partial [Propionicimonas sp.]
AAPQVARRSSRTRTTSPAPELAAVVAATFAHPATADAVVEPVEDEPVDPVVEAAPEPVTEAPSEAAAEPEPSEA